MGPEEARPEPQGTSILQCQRDLKDPAKETERKTRKEKKSAECDVLGTKFLRGVQRLSCGKPGKSVQVACDKPGTD